MRRGAKAPENGGFADRRFARRLALANLHRPDSLCGPRCFLGTALTLVVACTLMVTTLMRARKPRYRKSTGADQYEVFPDQMELLRTGLEALDSSSRVELLPMVRSRLATINQRPIAEAADNAEARREAMGMNTTELSSGNPEALELVEGNYGRRRPLKASLPTWPWRIGRRISLAWG